MSFKEKLSVQHTSPQKFLSPTIVFIMIVAMAGCAGTLSSESTSSTVGCPEGAQFDVEVDSPDSANAGTAAVINVTVTNTGDQNGTWEDALFFKLGQIGWVEGPGETLTLEPGETQTWTQEVTYDDAGVYEFKLYGEGDQFSIRYTEN